YSASVYRNEQYRLNMNQTRGWLENTESALQNGLDMLQRVRELAVYGANESLTAEDRRAIAPEVEEFIAHLIGVANTETNGLYIFGGHQTLKVPFIRKNTYHVDLAPNSGLDQEVIYSAEGVQNGSYKLDQSKITAVDKPGSANISQSYLQGNAQSIIGSATLESVGNVNASVLLEVTDINAETGQVDYIYKAHEYDLNGNYQKREGNFSLNFGGAAVQTVNIGLTTINVNGMDAMSVASATGLRVGDRSVIDVTPPTVAANSYDRITLSGEHRGGNSGMVYSFNQGALDGIAATSQEITLNYFSLDSFGRSPAKGKVYDGSIELTYNDTFNAAEAAVTFSYDSLGFPVYHGDNQDRIQ
ncbi:MAG: hypothetical protein U1E11_09080, partial [Dethiobacteria bacterium]|nr:hypothetical protein [Dethiobacteria bacterium]